MNPWVLFLAGFIAFPVALLLLALFTNRRIRVVPDTIRTSAQLQTFLRDLLNDDSRAGMLFLRDAESKLLIRVHKYARPRSPNTLAVELRRADAGVALYRRAREALDARGFEFSEEFTPKRRLPRRLQLLHQNGGPYAVTFVESLVATINDALHPGGTLDLLASHRQPGFWVAPEQRRK